MNNVKKSIGWCDYTWNPVTGCSPVSEGCENCYAAALSKRFGWTWGKPVFHPERLDEPMKLKKPSKIFVCSMGDLFHPDTPIPAQSAVWDTAYACPRHTFLILTKRVLNMRNVLFATNHFRFGVLNNIWLGATVENQARANERIPILLETPAAKHFVSVEPMLGSVFVTSSIDWVIAGPENGAGKRPCNPKWIDDLSKQSPCFYDKRKGAQRKEWPV